MKPSLSNRFRLALCLAHTMGHLCAINFVFRGMMSDNVLFFEKFDQGDQPPCISKPYLVGFSFARTRDLSNGYALPLSGSQNDTRLVLSDNLAENAAYYRPLDDLETMIVNTNSAVDMDEDNPQTLGLQLDIYALGVVLMEIGLWRSVLQIAPGGAGDFRKAVSKNIGKLRFYTGDLYAEAVQQCLQISKGGQTIDRSPQSVMINVIASLAKCSA